MDEVPLYGDARIEGAFEARNTENFLLPASFRALSGRLKFTVRRHKFNDDSLLREEEGGR